MTDEGSKSPKSTNFPATTCPTVFAGTGVKPGPTIKDWFRTGNDVADERLAWCSGRVDEMLSWDNKGAMLGMDSECEGVGGKKVNINEAPAKVEGAEKPAPDAAKAVACEDSSEGTPPKVATANELMIDGTLEWKGMEAGPGTNACSATSTALTAWMTMARNSGDG